MLQVTSKVIGKTELAPNGLRTSASHKSNGVVANGLSPSNGVNGSTFSVTPSQAGLVDDIDNGDCGWLCFKPKFLQNSRTAKSVLFWLCWAAAVQGKVFKS